MGTHWSPLDEKAQEKYKRGKATAEKSPLKLRSTEKAPRTGVVKSTGLDI